MSAIKYWMWLSVAPVSPKSRAALLEHYGDPETAFFAPKGDYAAVKGISPKDAARLERREIDMVNVIIIACQKQGIRLITLQDAEYPSRLRCIAAPPPVLFVKGELPSVDDEAVVAIIGTRRASSYGLRMARQLGYDTVRCGGVVINGYTSGAETAAVRGAMEAGGRYICVLGTSHDKLEPSLREELSEHGALVSEYAPGTKTEKFFFRDRNRITAALSLAVVVVEAPEHSGTRLFAETAKEQGKELFAVPGNLDSPTSAGANAMISAGARPATSAWDVLRDFSERYGRLKNAQGEPITDEAEPEKYVGVEKKKKKPASDIKKAVDNKKESAYIDLNENLLAQLTDEQRRIVEAMGDKPCYPDDIIERSGLSANRVLAGLTMLEIRGVVRRDSTRRVALNTAKTVKK